jgi:sugar fermentation stimulation protein A
MKIGRLGVYEFPRGYYVYTGSARQGMDARIRRHLSNKKRRHWHIDYLLEEGVVEGVYYFDKGECEVSREVFSLSGAALIVRKFGSTDCSCPSHLAFFEGEAPPDLGSINSCVIKKLFK